MASLNNTQQTELVGMIQTAGDFPTFMQQAQAVYASNTKAPVITAFSGVAVTVSDWTQFASQLSIANPALLTSLMTDIATSISGTNAGTLGPQLALLYLVVKKYLGV